MSGTVVDAAGRPVPGAKIYLDRYDFPADDKSTTTADAQGKFEISGLSPKRMSAANDAVWLTFKADGFAAERVELLSGETNMKVRMNRGYTVTGRVVDWDGNPVEGVHLEAEQQLLRLHTETDSGGRFTLKDVPSGTTNYSIGKQGYMQLEQYEIPAGTQAVEDPVEIKLSKPLRVFGKVVDADTGTPIPKFKMIAAVDYQDGRAPFWLEWFGDKTFDAENYEFGFRQSNSMYRLRVTAPGYMPVETPLLDPTDPDKRDVPFDFELKKTDEQVQGQVLGLNGEAGRGCHRFTWHDKI